MLTKIISKARPVNFTAVRSFAANNSSWAGIEMAPKDPILGINEAFKADPRKEKQLLGVGAYRTNEGKPLILECVKKAE